MRNKNSVTSSLSNKGTLTDAQINAGFGFNTILKSPDLNGQLYDIDSQVNIITKEICNFLIDNSVTLNANDDTQLSVLLTQLFNGKQKTLIAGSGITIEEDGTISSTSSSPANIPLFFSFRASYIPDNLSWVNSNSYSWLYASTYISAYDLLLDQYNPYGTFDKGDSYYVCTFSDGEMITTTVPANSGTLQQLQDWCSAQGYTYNAAVTIEEFECYKTIATSSETISGITIDFRRTRNGMKIIDTTQVAASDSIYNATGIANYFLLDTTNERFKLPRRLWDEYGTGNGELGDYIPETLPEIAGSFKSHNGSISQSGATGPFVVESLTAAAPGANTPGSFGSQLGFYASRVSSTYQANAPVQPRGVKGDLYFYLGYAGTEATVEIAGIKAETINNKADIDLSNLNSQGKGVISNVVVPDTTAPVSKSTSGFTADENGWIVAQANSKPANTRIEVDINSIRVSSFACGTTNDITFGFIRVYVGDVITCTNIDYLTFYPDRV